MLFSNYWLDLIQKNQQRKVSNPKLQETINENLLFETLYWKKLFLISKIKSRFKVLKFYLNKLNKFK